MIFPQSKYGWKIIDCAVAIFLCTMHDCAILGIQSVNVVNLGEDLRGRSDKCRFIKGQGRGVDTIYSIERMIAEESRSSPEAGLPQLG